MSSLFCEGAFMKRFISIFIVMLLLYGCGKAERAEQTQETTCNAVATGTMTVTEPMPTEAPLILHSGLRQDGTFTEGTLFIGDSMTCILVENYLKPAGLLGDANYTAKYGAQITAYFDGTVMTHKGYNDCAFRSEHENCTYEEVARQLGEKATAIYIMFGTNYTWDAYADAYIQLVDFLLETCPNATVHLQLIPDGNPYFVREDIVNPWIQEAYEHYAQLGQPRVMLIDTCTAIGLNVDNGGTHLDDKGNELWYKAICDHALVNGLTP